MKVALVHDSLAEYGGAERVLLALSKIFPQAPIYTAFYHPKHLGKAAREFANKDIRATYLAKLPFSYHLRSPLRLLAASAFSSLDLSEFEVIISSTNSYQAKAVRPRPGAIHLCYCHTPSRSLYGYDTSSNWRANRFTHFGGQLINHYLRLLDFKIAARPTVMIANSHTTAARIKKFYRRESELIYPPVMLPPLPANYQRPKQAEPYYLYVNRLQFAKHPELAIKACCQLGRRLKIVGTGSLFAQLKQLAAGKPEIEFLSQVDDEQLVKLYAGARALLYPVVDEDLGLVPLEAMSLGTPVIAHRSGGPLETIKPNVGGLFFSSLTQAGLVEAIKLFESKSFPRSQVTQSVSDYSYTSFRRQILALIKACLPQE